MRINTINSSSERYNPNFKANLIVKDWYYKTGERLINPARWENIAKSFEQKTKDYPKDSLTIKSNYLQSRVYNNGIYVSNEEFDQNLCFAEKLDNLKDNEVVDKLVKLYQYYRTESNLFLDIMQFADKLREKYGVYKFGTNPEGWGYCYTDDHSSTDELVHSLISSRHEFRIDNCEKFDLLHKLNRQNTFVRYNGYNIIGGHDSDL